MRSLNTPRSLGIPNPASYQRLCKCISEQWTQLQSHFQNVTENNIHKISRIHLRKMENESRLFQMNYSNWSIDETPEPDFLIGSKYLVEADISNCFPSIYSHSLSWALVGKDVAKQNKTNKIEWYNILDLYTRNIHNGETHGLIIGPHVSNLLSEIILTKIDQELYSKGYTYTRHIDDYSCYVETHQKGQAFLVDLNQQLHHYGLTLNHKKTQIVELPSTVNDQWVRRVNDFTHISKTTMNYREVQDFFDLAVELMKENCNNSAILNYVIKVLSNKKLTANAADYYVKIVLHLTLIYPYLVTLLDKYIFEKLSVEENLIAKFSEKLLASGKNTNNFEEMCFAIYFAIKYNFRIAGACFNDVKDSNHCILLLLAYLYNSRNKEKSEVSLFEDFAKSLIATEMNAYWLFIYETLPQSKLKDYWLEMKKNNVSFINIQKDAIREGTGT